MKKDSLFWMEFRVWVQRRIMDGTYSTFTVKRLYLIFKQRYLPEYIKNKNGIHYAYMNLIAFEDVNKDLYNFVVAPLVKSGVLVRVGRKKYKVEGAYRVGKMGFQAEGEHEKTPIREVDVSGGGGR